MLNMLQINETAMRTNSLPSLPIKRFPIYVRVEHISLKCRKTIEGLVGYEVEMESVAK